MVVHTCLEEPRMTLAQGFCELKYAETVARHMEVDAVRGASGFVSGRTTAVLPNDAPNYFGIGSI